MSGVEGRGSMKSDFLLKTKHDPGSGSLELCIASFLCLNRKEGWAEMGWIMIQRGVTERKRKLGSKSPEGVVLDMRPM